MVRECHAWAYTRYLKDTRLLRAQEDARREQRGLWSLPAEQHIPPWEWRQQQRLMRKQAR
jgi:endonuclease YncB( thermonuclease family)